MTYEEARTLIQEHMDYGGSLDSHGLAVAMSAPTEVIADTAGAKPEPQCECASNPHAETCPITAHVRAMFAASGESARCTASPAIDAAPDNSQYFNAREVIAAMILEHEDGGLTADTVQRARDICYSPLAIPNAAERCDMGVGCEEAGVCFAKANGEPDRCPKNAIDAAGASSDDVRDAARYRKVRQNAYIFGIGNPSAFTLDQIVDASIAKESGNA